MHRLCWPTVLPPSDDQAVPPMTCPCVPTHSGPQPHWRHRRPPLAVGSHLRIALVALVFFLLGTFESCRFFQPALLFLPCHENEDVQLVLPYSG